MKFQLSLWLSLASTVPIIIAHKLNPIVKVIPSAASEVNTKAEFISSEFGLDSPKLSTVNSTSWDWWYFDAVSTDLKSHLSIVFYTSLPYGFPFTSSLDHVTSVGLYFSFPNGTVSSTDIEASEAVVTSVGQSASGVWKDTGASFASAEDSYWYDVYVNSPSNGISGTFKLLSKAPAHYPCGPVKAGENMMVGPNIGWSNAVPDANAVVDFKIGNDKMTFTGIGYHDKNWSPQPFAQNVGSWDWGHGRVGDYSLVWFDFVGVDQKEYISAYVAKNGKVIVSSCSPGSIKVRPEGGDTTYPPKLGGGWPEGFKITVESDGHEMQFHLVSERIVLGAIDEPFSRWIGTLNGKVDGVEVKGGQAVYEEFRLIV